MSRKFTSIHSWLACFSGAVVLLMCHPVQAEPDTPDTLAPVVSANEPAAMPAATQPHVELIIEDASDVPATLSEATIEPTNSPSATAAETSAPAKATPEPVTAGVLNNSRQFALSMIETGINDNLVGGLGEVSRYQIMPSVWKNYREDRNYRDPDAATEVARQHWAALYDYYQRKADREPTDFDMYVLWNTRYGYYAGKGFQPANLSRTVRDRAQRFTNLVEDSQRRETLLAMAPAAESN
jgi:hypothetical protein